ncbi:MAG: hypothetical protein ACPGU5_06160 [Lishizhenia sp.]
MKKTIGLLIGLALVIGLGYYAYNLQEKSKKSDNTELIDFEIKNVENIDKIEIYDPYFQASFTLLKKGDVWTDKNGGCVQQNPVKTILETFKKVTFSGYVNDAAKTNVTNLMAAKAKKVTVYEQGEMKKIWYVGHSTPDHLGTYMLVETPEVKSDQPVIMGMQGLNGILEPRFFVDPKIWACTDLFSATQAEIKKVSIKNNIDNEDSYEITRNGSGFVATQNTMPIENVNQEKLTFFTNSFENIHFNKPNYEFTQQQVDSIRNSNPYIEMNIDKKDGTSLSMNFYKNVDRSKSTPNNIVYDPEYVWAFTQDDRLVKVQYFVMGPIIDGKDFFVNKTVNN